MPRAARHVAQGAQERTARRPARAPRDRPRSEIRRAELGETVGQRARGVERGRRAVAIRDQEGVSPMSEATTNGTDTTNELDQTALRELIDRALDERAADDGYNKKNKITIIAW